MTPGKFWLLALLSLSASGAPVEDTTEWFSDKPRELRPLLADPREAQVRTGALVSGSGKKYYDLGLGGHLGILRFQNSRRELSFVARASANSRFQFQSKSFDLHNVDYVGALSASYRASWGVLELMTGHQSSHLGDDVVMQGFVPMNTSFEFIRLLYSREFGPELRLYGGTETKASADPARLEGQTTLIIGGDSHFIRSLPNFFTAFDIRFRQENHFQSSLAVMAGYELGDPERVSRRQRFFIEVFNGASALGQFARQDEFYVMAGFGFTP